MEFTINRQTLLKNLTDVQRSITSKTTIPILTGVKLHLTDTELSLMGSDSIISIERLIPVSDAHSGLSVVKTGQIVLPSRFFGEIIRKLSDKTVTLKLLDNHLLEIKSGKSIFTINSIDAELYPKINMQEHDQIITLPTYLFKNVIAQTVVATSTKEERPILTGIHLTFENKTLTATATDSHRMSRRVIDLPDLADHIHYQCTISARSLVELSRILADDDQLTMSFDESKVLFQAENLYFYTSLLEGNYPDISRLIRNDFTTRIQVNAAELLAAVERVSILSIEGKTEIAKFTIGSQFMLSSESSNVGYVEEEVTAKTIDGPAVSLSFNPNYMKDALKVFNGIDIDLYFLEDNRPFSLRPENDEKNTFVQLITPIRTQK